MTLRLVPVSAAMGQGACKVEAHADADSLVMPGEKSVVSDSLEPYLDYTRFLDEISKCLKDPPARPIEKGRTLVDGESGFRLDVTLDGQKLKEHSPSASTAEDVTLVSVYKVDREKGVIYNEQRTKDWYLFEVNVTVVHRDPLRVEVWQLTPVRRSGPVLAGFMQHMLDYIIKPEQPENTVRTSFDVEKPESPGIRSVLSDALDGHISFDALWEGLLEWYRCLKNLPTVARTEPQEVSETEFHVTVTYDAGHQHFVKVLHGREAGGIAAEFYRVEDHALIDTWYIAVQRKPALRLEMWADKMSQRKSGESVRAVVQEVINTILERAAASSSSST